MTTAAMSAPISIPSLPPALPRRIGLRVALAGLALSNLFNELAFLIGVMVYGF